MSALLSRLLRHPSGRIGTLIILSYIAAAVLAQAGLTPYDPLQQIRAERLQGPTLAHWMGSDMIGRDVLSRLMAGIGQSLLVAGSAVGISATLGAVMGLTAAWFGAFADGLIMRAMDVLLAFPSILLALLVIAVLGPGAVTTSVAIALVYTPIFTRVVRAPALSIKRREFVDAARACGSSTVYILTRHLMLNLVGPLTAQVTLALAWSLLTESGLSFLGLGTQPPQSSLGLMLSESVSLMEMAPWLLVFPSLAIMLGVLGFSLLGDALRDCLDPRTRRTPA
jgi:peptide/nickel transport system permease protein